MELCVHHRKRSSEATKKVFKKHLWLLAKRITRRKAQAAEDERAYSSLNSLICTFFRNIT